MSFNYKGYRHQHVKRFCNHVASNREREENAHLLFKDDKLMILRATTSTTNLTTLLQLHMKKRWLKPTDVVNVEEQKVKRQDLNRVRLKVLFASLVYSSQIDGGSFILWGLQRDMCTTPSSC